MKLKRRGFLKIGAGLLSSALLPYAKANNTSSHYYPPSLTGLRGNHAGSESYAHAIAWHNKKIDLSQATPQGDYDLIVVGAGISGLTTVPTFI